MRGPVDLLRRAVSVAGGVALLLLTRHGAAQIDLARLVQGMQGDGRAPLSAQVLLPDSFHSGRAGRIPLVVRAAGGAAPSAPGLVSLGNVSVGEFTPEQALALFTAQPSWSFDWAPPRHVLLDKVDGWIHGSAVRSEFGLSGQGVVLGIVDTGLDLTHPDFQTAAGGTRVQWLLDFSKSAQGLQPTLEQAYGCGGDIDCAVYSATDIDSLLAAGDASQIPTDSFGHGSHVGSLAGGNGLGSASPKYIGVAPEATFVVARVTRADDGLIQDTDVLRAVKFVFDRASELGMPAVVNLSLGSDFGAHDGSSGLEQGLADFVGPNHPGRAVVVAAGNSAALYDGGDQSEVNTAGNPGPFGIHTEVSIARDSSSNVPVITPVTDGDGVTVSGRVYVWLQFSPGDEVTVSLYDKSGQLIRPISRGQATSAQRGDCTATIFNGTSGSDASSVELGANGAVVVLDGSWPADENFTLRLEGHGTAELWMESTGALELGIGALFPRGEKQGTINVPASAAALIAVGATVNRTSWTDVDGDAVSMPEFGSLDPVPLDSTAYFSSAGPSLLGVMKPDIVAPGVYVAGAMAAAADPRNSGASVLFQSQGRCATLGLTSDCFVVDEKHAITSGTSMSAPIVAGAIALLFQRDPSLTEDGARALLQAGARPLQGVTLDERQVGPGALDLQGAVDVQDAESTPVQRDPGRQTWLVLSQSYANPDPSRPVQGYLELRDDNGQLADGFDPGRLRLETQSALLLEPLTRVAPGLERFQVAAPAGSGGEQLGLQVLFDDKVLVSRTLPIGVDRWVAEGGVSARGGCSVASGARPRDWFWLFLCAGATVAGFRVSRNRRCRRAARMDRDPDRVGATRRRRPC
ncbi:MAG TPA: S8 family serine peptidase [Polyangiaceae bacterium]|jgi:subtilisin family serine protease